MVASFTESISDFVLTIFQCLYVGLTTLTFSTMIHMIKYTCEGDSLFGITVEPHLFEPRVIRTPQ